MLEDQKYILDEIIRISAENNAEGIIVAGDIFDKSTPSAEAVALFDSFLTRLCEIKMPAYIISGNHDSPERIAYGGRVMQFAEIYISPVYDGNVSRIVKNDEYGELNIYLLPFVKPANVRCFYPDEDTSSYTAALQTVLKHTEIDKQARNIIVCHQFVSGACAGGSEDLIAVGTLECIDPAVFDGFDYTALGHIHRAQNLSDKKVRYCGTPLKYSLSECSHKKSVTIIELKEKGNLYVETYPLKPLRDMRKIRGSYDELMSPKFYSEKSTDDYIGVTLTDENDIPNVMDKMSSVYKNIMDIHYDNKRTQSMAEIEEVEQTEEKSPSELFEQLFEQQNNSQMSKEQSDYILSKIEMIWGEH